MTPPPRVSSVPHEVPAPAPAPAPAPCRGDAEVAGAVEAALRSAVDFCAGRVGAQLEAGVVTLTGQVPWAYQREVAERCVARVEGVHGTRNEIEVASSALPVDLARAVVEGVLLRHALARARACRFVLGADGGLSVTGGAVDEAEAEEVNRLLRGLRT